MNREEFLKMHNYSGKIRQHLLPVIVERPIQPDKKTAVDSNNLLEIPINTDSLVINILYYKA